MEKRQDGNLHPTMLRVGAVFTLVVSLLAGAIGSAGALDTTPIRAGGMLPRTDGDHVVWQAVNENQGVDIYWTAPGDWMPRVLEGGFGDQQSPDLDDGVAVFSALDETGNFDIVGKEIASGVEFMVADTPGTEFLPSISGNWVVWIEAWTGSDEMVTLTLLARDITALGEPTTLDQVQVGSGGGGFSRPEISRDRIAWLRFQQTSGHAASWELKTQKIGQPSATVVAADSVAIGGPGAHFGSVARPAFDLAGDTLVYTFNLNLWLVDLASGQRDEIASAQGGSWEPAQNPTTDGRYIFWQDYRQVGDLNQILDGVRFGTLRSDIIGYDIRTGSGFPVTTNTGYNSRPQTSDGVLVYERRTQIIGEGGQIHAAYLSQVLPSASMPDPGTRDPNWIYFSPTRHYLASGFKTFWAASGGLSVLGYPLTEEFTEHGLTAQYFERQRFEYHPEHAGTPYAVELGRLGAEAIALTLQTVDSPFQPLPRETPSDGNCTVVPETRHRLCGGFKAYWQAHGLEFGDAGVSERESLALFGYPLSEEFVDPGSGLTVQWFERARFEEHPGNPEPSRVLLGRLGAERLAERGW